MRTTPVQGPSVWRAADLASDPSWILVLDDGARGEILSAVATVRAAGTPLVDISREDFPLPRLGPRLDAVIDEIEGGRGVTLVRGAPIEGLDAADIERMFWGLACHIGYPEPQDQAGKRLHHVRAEHVFHDADSAATAFRTGRMRGYQTNVELDFHGDGSDALFFLCVRPGQTGGLSRVVSAGTAFNAVMAHDPRLSEVLQQDFRFDARGELGPDRPCQTAPVYAEHRGRLNILYKRGYIELATVLPGAAPLTDLQRAALDALDAALNDPAHFHEFRMQPGDIQIANNYAVLHARTTFEDHEEPERKRHMLRIWATLRRNRRPLPVPFRLTREFAASQRRRESLGDPVE